jgi:hypothetical protein
MKRSIPFILGTREVTLIEWWGQRLRNRDPVYNGDRVLVWEYEVLEVDGSDGCTVM